MKSKNNQIMSVFKRIVTSKFFLFIYVFIVVVACATNPLTGRQSLSLVDNSQIFPQAFAQYSTVLSDSKISTNVKQTKMIKSVGERLKVAAEKYYASLGLQNQLKDYAWEFNLIESPELNAWCMPGGKVAFYTGIIPICENETGIAVVMGHEITHALAGHGSERMSQGMLMQGVGAVAGSAIKSDQWRSAFAQYYPIAGQLTLLKYGRNQELDSDKGGLYLMAIAGFDPRASIGFWQRMQKASEGKQKQPQFLSTHPDPSNRIADLNKNMEKAMEYYNKSNKFIQPSLKK